MNYLMPSADTKENLPKTNDTSVQAKNTSAEYTPLIGSGRYVIDEDMKFYPEYFKTFLKKILSSLSGIPGFLRIHLSSILKKEIIEQLTGRKNK